MNIQCILIWELILYKFELGHYAAEITENICCAKDSAVDYSAVTRWFKKFCSDCKNLVDSMLQAIEANLASKTQRVPGELGISQSNEICHLQNLNKSIQSCQIVPHFTRIFQNFWLILVNTRPVDSDCEIQWLHLCRRVRHLQQTSWIWY